jgi:hypothetical protein
MTLIGTILLSDTVDKHLATSNPFLCNYRIQIDGIATITGIIEGNQTSFDVYVLMDTSLSLLLDTEYLRPNGVILSHFYISLTKNYTKNMTLN